MKIQVSFDRTTKKEFRDQCVKRLQQFVQQMRSSERNSKLTNRDSLCDQPLGQNMEDLRCKFEEIIPKKIDQRAEETKKHVKSDKKEYKQVSLKQQIEGIKLATTAQSKNQLKNVASLRQNSRQSSRVNFNLGEIKQNVYKIMEKLQKSSKKQDYQYQQLSTELYNTNQKLDMLIVHLQNTKISPKYAPSQLAETQCNICLDSPNRFDRQFNQLANKYNRIKENSVHPSSRLSRASKSIFSLESTSDSVTFRQN